MLVHHKLKDLSLKQVILLKEVLELLNQRKISCTLQLTKLMV